MTEKMSQEEHRARHVELHGNLDELLADYVEQTGDSLNYTTVLEFLTWSYEQTQQPTEKAGITPRAADEKPVSTSLLQKLLAVFRR